MVFVRALTPRLDVTGAGHSGGHTETWQHPTHQDNVGGEESNEPKPITHRGMPPFTVLLVVPERFEQLERFDRLESSSSEVRLQHILLQHAVGIKKRSVERDRMAHDVEKVIAILIE